MYGSRLWQFPGGNLDARGIAEGEQGRSLAEVCLRLGDLVLQRLPQALRGLRTVLRGLLKPSEPQQNLAEVLQGVRPAGHSAASPLQSLHGPPEDLDGFPVSALAGERGAEVAHRDVLAKFLSHLPETPHRAMRGGDCFFQAALLLEGEAEKVQYITGEFHLAEGLPGQNRPLQKDGPLRKDTAQS